MKKAFLFTPFLLTIVILPILVFGSGPPGGAPPPNVPGYSLSVDPENVEPGEGVVVHWTAIEGHNGDPEVVAIFALGSSNISQTDADPDYATIEQGVNSGEVTFTAPQTEGVYVFVYIAKDGNDMHNMTTSNQLTVAVIPDPTCGDGTCDPDEDCTTCEDDCEVCVIDPVCGNDVIEDTEECDGTDMGGATCADIDPSYDTGTPECSSCTLVIGTCATAVAAPTCGDGTCDPDEDCTTCEDDCEVCVIDPVCGNDVIEDTEECDGTDMGGATCADIDPSYDTGTPECSSCTLVIGTCATAVAAPTCGDGTCDPDEDCTTCEDDCDVCPDVCGDDICGVDESCTTCEADCDVCPPICGDGDCNGDEVCSTCSTDCGVCQVAGLTNLYLALDVGLPIGGVLFEVRVYNAGESSPITTFSIIADSQERLLFPSNSLYAGAYDLYIETQGYPGERVNNISLDSDQTVYLSADSFCGDSECKNGETCTSCASDCGVCASVCGDGDCASGESCSTCSQDCGTCASISYCGDDSCSGNESCSTCSQDCGACAATCGDGDCSSAETCLSCSNDCGLCPASIECGNGVKETGEQCDGSDLGGITCSYFSSAHNAGAPSCLSCVLGKGTCKTSSTYAPSSNPPTYSPPSRPTGKVLKDVYLAPLIEGTEHKFGKSFKVEIYKTGDSTPTKTFSAKANIIGNLSVELKDLVKGTYDIRIKSDKHLAEKINGIELSSDSVIPMPVELPAGDLNGDNVINSLDWSVMNENWSNNLRSDITGNGKIDSEDFSYLAKNWFMTGD